MKWPTIEEVNRKITKLAQYHWRHGAFRRDSGYAGDVTIGLQVFENGSWNVRSYVDDMPTGMDRGNWGFAEIYEDDTEEYFDEVAEELIRGCKANRQQRRLSWKN